jgi:NADH-quinone oxidoreductase subunit B
VAGDVRPRLLRDRDDGDGRRQVRHRALRHGALRQIYDQMAEPKWVIAMGVCASSGGMFNNYAIIQGVDHIVPVDMYLPGCPPRPEMLLDSILKLHAKIQAGDVTGKLTKTEIDDSPYQKPIVRGTAVSAGLPVLEIQKRR